MVFKGSVPATPLLNSQYTSSFIAGLAELRYLHEMPLENAVDWCISQGLEFDAINENVPEIIERFGSNSRKIYADLYFDDKAYREVCRHDQMEEQIDNKIS